ncbi:hypothetical protein KTE91_03655 [Burkholderia multivorans]|uniref:hypothetical protein n=1 Tax=Burkholderiaceae TaxID=119060 RepID=UPI000AFFF9FE|nr:MULTISPECIES: hypothetical protein [Burkholderiaceae]MBU9434179.1 hypothetical protein [Burkholderia multivorans]
MKSITKIIIAASISFLTYKAYGAYQASVDPDHVEGTITATKYGNEYRYEFPTDKHLQDFDKQDIKNRIEGDPHYLDKHNCEFQVEYERTRDDPEWNIGYVLSLTQIRFKIHTLNNTTFKKKLDSTCTEIKEGDIS